MKRKGITLDTLCLQYQRNDLRHGFFLKDPLVRAVFQVSQLRHQGDLVTGQALAGIALRHPVHLAMNAVSLRIKPQERLTVQEAIEVQVGLFAHQLKVKTKRQADKFITRKPSNLEFTGLPIKGQVKGTLIGKSKHPVSLLKGWASDSAPAFHPPEHTTDKSVSSYTLGAGLFMYLASKARQGRVSVIAPPHRITGKSMATRYAKIILTLALAAFATLVAFNNITDYGSNFAFVQHVLSMDTTFPNNAAMYRSITTPWMWHAADVLIILGEALTAVLLARGALSLWRARHAGGSEFNRARAGATAGLTLGFVVWFFGFMVVGGEWFLMWQSHQWNGQEAAFKFYMAILGVLIFLNQPDAG